MSDFNEFYAEVISLAEKYKDTMIKMEYDKSSTILKIFGEKISSLERAKSGLSDVSEMSYTVAEHHPYWNLLYQCSEISKTILDRWNDSLSADDQSQMKWSIDQLLHSLEKIDSR